MRIARNPRRGVFMFGFAALLTILAVLCALVLARSLDAYRVSATLEQRLQARAAAEGAAVAIESRPDGTHEPMMIGTCEVSFAVPQNGESATIVPLTVSVKPNGKRETLSRDFTAVYARGNGTWALERLVQGQ